MARPIPPQDVRREAAQAASGHAPRHDRGGKLRRAAACCFLSLGVLLCGAARAAEDYPPRRPGLWEMTINTGQGAPQTVRYCVDAATDAALQKMGQANMGQMCSRFALRRSGSAVTADAVCRMGDTQVTTHSVTTFTADTATHTVATSRFDPPMPGGLAEGRMTQDGRWLGPCGPDMKPGDMIVNGNRMHMPMAADGK